MIPVVRTQDRDFDLCCFCRHRTGMWTDLPDREPGEQVACCDSCASRAEPEDVPTKAEWFRREKIANP
jgi:hypothetical protein